MRSRITMIVALVAAIAAIGYVFFHVPMRRIQHPAIAEASMSPALATYLGVFEGGSPPAYAPVAEFGRAAGRQPNLVGYYSGWLEPFNVSFADKMRDHGVTMYVQIDPTLAAMTNIVAGDYDDYLRAYADDVRAFGHAVVIGFGHEMNTGKYPWGYGHVRPSAFVAAWRHIVTLFRAQGARNVTWLWTINVDYRGTGPVAAWWPGHRYVTWVGIDGYYYRPTDTFASVFGKTIDQVRTITRDPILLSETAVGPAANQFVKIQDLFRGMAKYKTLGLVWFDQTQHDGIYHQDWRIEGHQLAEDAFRLGVRDDLKPVA